MLDFPPNWTFAIQFVGFFVLLIILDRLLFRPFSDVLDRREASTHGATQAADGDRRAAAELKSRIEASLTDAKLEAHGHAERIRRATQVDEKAIFDEAKSALAVLSSDARKALDAEIATARSSLSAGSRVVADQMVAAVLRRKS